MASQFWFHPPALVAEDPAEHFRILRWCSTVRYPVSPVLRQSVFFRRGLKSRIAYGEFHGDFVFDVGTVVFPQGGQGFVGAAVPLRPLGDDISQVYHFIGWIVFCYGHRSLVPKFAEFVLHIRSSEGIAEGHIRKKKMQHFFFFFQTLMFRTLVITTR